MTASGVRDIAARPLSQGTSDTIRLARIFGIFFTAYIHAWPGAGGVLDSARLAEVDWIGVLFIDWLGRGAVPLLSVVSGMLAWQSLSARHAGPFLAGKLRTLILPMAIWNIVFMVLLLSASLVGFAVRLPLTGWPDWLLALSAQPVNRPLGFLRDVFVCMVLAVGLHPLLQRMPAAALALTAAIAVLAYADVMPVAPLFLRPAIFVMFALGMVLARFDLIAAFSGWRLGLLALSGLVVVDLLVPSTFRMLGPDLCNLVRRLCIATIFWQACSLVVRYAQGRRLLWLERYIFFFFCTHMVVFSVMGSLASLVLTDVTSLVFWIYVLLQPVLGMIVVVEIHKLGQRLVPVGLALATGQPVGRRPQRSI